MAVWMKRLEGAASAEGPSAELVRVSVVACAWGQDSPPRLVALAWGAPEGVFAVSWGNRLCLKVLAGFRDAAQLGAYLDMCLPALVVTLAGQRGTVVCEWPAAEPWHPAGHAAGPHCVVRPVPLRAAAAPPRTLAEVLGPLPSMP
jgi:hypothetical protein